MSRRVLVTGGAGFIGSHVVDRLVERGDEVRVLDSVVEQVHGVEGPRYLNGGAEFVRGDVRDGAVVAAATAGVDSVIHLAAEVGVGQSMYEVERYVDANICGTAILLEHLVGSGQSVERFVVASSMSIYGEGSYVCDEHGIVFPRERGHDALRRGDYESRCPECSAFVTPVPTSETKPICPTSVYAISKLDQELLTLSLCGAYGIGALALRFFNVYGARQALSNPYTGVGAIFSSRLLNGRPPLVFEDGEQLRDFVHVDDVARAVVLALDSPCSGEALNVGTGEPISVNGVAKLLAAELGVDLAPEITGQYRAGDIRHCYADPTRAEEILGFRAAVPFSCGVAELTRWVSEQIATDGADVARSQLEARGLTR
jgi:dTDP-L-rhamnose 4-epimerase